MTLLGDDVELSDLGPRALLAEGGQGKVYRLAHDARRVYKAYLPGARPSPVRLAGLIKYLQRLPDAEREFVVEHAAWPQHRVLDRGRCVGFLMTAAPREYFHEDVRGDLRLNEVQFLMYPRKKLWGSVPEPDPSQRRALALAAIRYVGLLHRHSVVLGDISMRNTLWTLDEGGAVFGLDCDSYRVAGNRPAVDQPDTPDWDDPHARPGLATLDSDRYKLALLVVRILARQATVRPEDARDDPGVLAQLPSPARAVFVAAATPGARPDADQWEAAVQGAGGAAVRPAPVGTRPLRPGVAGRRGAGSRPPAPRPAIPLPAVPGRTPAPATVEPVPQRPVLVIGQGRRRD